MYTLWFIIIILISMVVYYYVINFYNIRGQYYSAKGKPDEALKCYGRAYERKPNVNNTLNYGYLLLRAGRFDEADTILNSAFLLSKIKEDDRMRVRMMLALLKWQRGDIDSAISIYEELLKKEENTTIFANLGFLYIQKGDLQKALEFNKRGFEYNNANNVIIDNLAECCFMSGDYDRAYELLEKAVSSKQPIAENYFHFAKVLKVRGEYDKALEYLGYADGMSINSLSGISKDDIERLKKEITDAQG